MKRYYIGLSASTHDPAVAIVNSEGEVVFAESTERHLQFKRAPNCEPDNAHLVELLREYCEPDAEFVGAINWSRLNVFGVKLLSHLGMLSPEKITATRDGGVRFNTPFSLKSKMTYACAASMYQKLGVGLAYATRFAFGNPNCRIKYFSHHLCHAAVACYWSEFPEASCIILDGAGDFGSVSLFRYAHGEIRRVQEQKGFTSLGHFYEDVTWLCGFNPDEGEQWKVMGFAPYGAVDQDAYRLLSSVFTVEGYRLKSLPMRTYKSILKQLQDKIGAGALERADLAHTAQKVFSETIMRLLNQFYDAFPDENLILAGGCALNSSTNGLILDQTKFKRLFVPCAPADDGTAVGAALLAHRQYQSAFTPRRCFQTPYLGSEISSRRVQEVVSRAKIEKLRHCPNTIHMETAKLLADGCIVGWVQGRAEFGPRSLGNRSILADPQPAGVKDKINSLVKFRETFRPFAPSILHEHGAEYFENYQESPYMERTLRFRKEVYNKVPGVVHVDGSGRVQTIKREWNQKFYDLLRAFYELTKTPMLLNTSFNVMGKPIIDSLEDAISVFYTTGLDALVIQDYLIEK